jgi:DNA-binding MarR family transcriptional regulator
MKYISSLDREHRLWVWLHHTLHVLYRAREKELAQFDIPLMQAGVLFIIETISEPKTPAKISRQLLRERHSVHTLLNRMEQQGLLYKTRDSNNKRLVTVSLTERGHQLYNQLYNPPIEEDVLSRVFSTLSPQEQQQLESYLRRLLHRTLDELQMGRALRYL